MSTDIYCKSNKIEWAYCDKMVDTVMNKIVLYKFNETSDTSKNPNGDEITSRSN